MTTDLYSTLFKSINFWNIFSSHNGVLLYQVNDPEFTIYHFTHFDYVGAPWCADNDILKPLLDQGIIKYLVGNGGFSWRTVESMKECVLRMGGDSPVSEPEDCFFVRCFSKYFGTYDIAPVEVAQTFSVEVPSWDFKAQITADRRPLALHATWYNADERLVGSILQIP